MNMRKSLVYITILLLLVTTALPIGFEKVAAQIPPGIPRGDIFILSMDDPGRIMPADDFNVWKPGKETVNIGAGLVWEPLYFFNVTNGRFVPMLAESLPEYSSDYKTVKIKLRKGVYWSDGVEFTADDVVYTIETHLKYSGLHWSATIQKWVKSAKAIDKYTVVIELKEPNPQFHMFFTTIMGSPTGLMIMPKHIFEKVEDPLKDKFNPPVGTSPYVLVDFDRDGYWYLFKRRDDWQRSATGIVLGKPKPKYVLRIFYGTDEKDLIALTKHELDETQISWELWEEAKKKNPYLIAFYKGFPYVWQQGICDHGIVFNLDRYPYNITDVRWALTLSIDIVRLNIEALNAMGRIATFRGLSVKFVSQFYEEPLTEWLKEFSLPDGFKPFDPTIPQRLAEYVTTKMGEKLGASPEEIWGPGWWKYAPEEASKLLEKHGFKKGADGKWYMPDGKPFKVKIMFPSYHALVKRIVYGVAEQWKEFGIDVELEAIPTSGEFFDRVNIGDFELASWWYSCCAAPNPYRWWEVINPAYYKPIGEIATANQMRWKNQRVPELLEKLAMLPVTPEPEVIETAGEIYKETVKDMIAINLFMGSKLLVYDTYVWKNFPTADNWYWERSPWNPPWILPILVKIEPTGNVPSSEYAVTTTTTAPPVTTTVPITVTTTMVPTTTVVTAPTVTATALPTVTKTSVSVLTVTHTQVLVKESAFTFVVLALQIVTVILVIVSLALIRRRRRFEGER